jgi:hypothetical protein
MRRNPRARALPPPPTAYTAMPFAHRVQFVREANGKRYFIDRAHPDRGEFYLEDTSHTPTLIGQGEATEVWLYPHPEYPELGRYYIDQSGHPVFQDTNGLFYPTIWENGQVVRVRVAPRVNDTFRSRAGGGAATTSRDGSYSRGSAPSDSH